MARRGNGNSGGSGRRGSSADEVVSLVFSVPVVLAMFFGALLSSDKSAKKTVLVLVVTVVTLAVLYDLAR